MKNMFKTVVIVMILSIMIGVMSGCGTKKIDYATWKYQDFVSAESSTDNYWNSKKIVYQYVMREEGNASPYTGVYWGMLNLYEDGSAAMWEPSGLTKFYFDGVERYDEKYAILEMFYGYWTKQNSDIKVVMTYSEDSDPSTFTASVASMPSTMTVELAYSGGPIPGFDFDCDGTVHYATWEEYCTTHDEVVTELEG